MLKKQQIFSLSLLAMASTLFADVANLSSNRELFVDNQMIEKMDINKDHFMDNAIRHLEKRVKVSGGQIYMGQALNKVLISAEDEAKQMELTCTANNGNLSIADKTNNKSYSGTYKHKETSTESVIYEVEIDGMEGMAVVSMTAYQNGEEEPTFIISLEEYSINFYAE